MTIFSMSANAQNTLKTYSIQRKTATYTLINEKIPHTRSK